MRQFTFGSYCPGDSLFHRSDPRTKIILASALLVAAFVVDGYPALLFLVSTVLCVALLAGGGMASFLKGLRPLLWLSIFTAAMSLLFVQGAATGYGDHRHLFLEGLGPAGKMFLRLFILACTSSLIMVTTTPLSLTDGLERLLKPLKRIGLPVHELAMMVAVSIRFIPTILEEARRIISAQSSRCPRSGGGGMIGRGIDGMPLVVPLFMGALRRGNDLATAMEARCYRGGAGRTRLKGLQFSRADLASSCFMVAVLAVLMILERTGN